MNPARRLLVVSYHFPPDGAVGGLRWAALSKYLTRLGLWEVHVLTAAEGARAAAPPGVVVHEVPRRPTLNDRYRELRTASQHIPAQPAPQPAPPVRDAPPAAVHPPRHHGLITALRREGGYALAMPDHSRGWITAAAREARRLTRKWSFDAIVSSGPPHSAHVVGALASRSIPHVLDYRDPWVHQLDLAPEVLETEPRLRYWLEPRLRRFVEGGAAAIIAVTEDFASQIRGGGARPAVHWLRNGVDPERLPTREPAREPYVAHVGTLYFGRDVTPVLQALRLVLDRSGGGESPPLTLRLAGSIDESHRARLEGQIERLRLADRVELLGVLPGPDALRVTRGAALSLVLAQNQPQQIPAKLYESVGMGLPTLAIAERDSATFREAERIGAMARVADDIEGIAGVLDRFARSPREGLTPREPIGYPELALRVHDILLEAMQGEPSGRAQEAAPAPAAGR